MITSRYTNPSALDDIPDGWRVQSIESVCQRVTSGGTPLRSNKGFYENGTIRWVKTGELKDWYIRDTEEKITAEAVKNSSAKILPKNTILMAMYGDGKTITSLGLLQEEASSNQACCALIVNPDICHFLYLFYALKYHRGDFLQLATGGAQRNLSGTLIRNFAIKIPPLSEQYAIAQILGTLDDKIELNRQMNETLEAIARAFFKSWFVDFDPVVAKMEGCQPVGMDDETAALFPDSFEDSAFGKIPKGWHVAPLGEVIAINDRSITKDYPHQTIQYVDISSVTEGRLEGTTTYALIDAPSRAKRLVKHGNTIWSTVRPNRKSFLFIYNPDDKLVVSTGFVVLTPRSIPPSYLYAWVTTDQFVDYLAYNADGSAYPAVLPGRFVDAKILLPSAEILQEFERLVGPFRALIAQNESTSRTLSAVRDALLPKLLSGEIRVKDAEKFMEALV